MREQKKQSFIFQMLTKVKLAMPHEHVTSFAVLLSTVQVPQKSAFYSTLRCSDITNEEYDNFVQVWEKMEIQNLFQLYELYNILDTTMYADSFSFFYMKLYKLTNLWPSRFSTLASLSTSSLLLNGRLAGKPRKLLSFPFLDSSTYDLIANNQLTGGYSSSSCLFR